MATTTATTSTATTTKPLPKLYLTRQSYYDEPTDNFNGFSGYDDIEIFNFNKWFENFINGFCCSGCPSTNEFFIEYMNETFYENNYIPLIIFDEERRNFLPKYHSITNIRHEWYEILQSYYKLKLIIKEFMQNIKTTFKNHKDDPEKFMDDYIKSSDSASSIDVNIHLMISAKSQSPYDFATYQKILDDKMRNELNEIIKSLSPYFEVIYDEI
jgi:hypothetical protein